MQQQAYDTNILDKSVAFRRFKQFNEEKYLMNNVSFSKQFS